MYIRRQLSSIVILLFGLDGLEESLGEGSRRIIITGGIIGTLAYDNGLDFSFDGVDGETLAPSDDSDRGRTGVGHLHIESLGELCCWVGKEGYHGLTNALVFPPCLHDGGIVYTVNDDLLDASFLESFLVLKVSWNLLCRSGGGESTGETDDDDVLVSTILSDVNLLNIGESLHYLNKRELGGSGEGGGCTEGGTRYGLHAQEGSDGKFLQ
mmetsp:Transcript_3013/g.4551  ORF Transcript_3013/g.4551 Transcript_3013/m.4551 type:complete len:211 (-) Transcript_3013:6-638(-)